MAKIIEKNPILTVVIPVHRMAGRLQEIQRIVNAEVEFRVVIVHDVGDFETGTQLKKILKESLTDKITLIEGKFGSPGAARNAGLATANSTWVAFWDCDDSPSLEVYKDFQSCAALDYRNSDLIIYDYSIEDLRCDKLRKIQSQRKIQKVVLDPGIWRIIFRRTSIAEIKFPNISMAEDQVFLLNILNQTTKISFSTAIAYTYRIGVPNQLTSRKEKFVEIQTAMQLESQILKSTSLLKVKYLGAIMLSRQFLTCLFRGDWNLRVSTLNSFPQLVRSTNFLLPLVILTSLPSLLLAKFFLNLKVPHRS